MKRIDLGQNVNGTRSEIWLGDNEIVVRDMQDVSAILSNNARLRAQNGKRNGRNGTLVAEVPETVVYEWKKEWRRNHADKWSWMTFFMTRLNNRDYYKFRTTETRI